MSTTFYLKYRPQTIKDLDLTNVREQLSKVLKAKSVPHAFLFSGPRGLGKTSAARILAKALNCKNLKGFEPCNECDVCKSVTKGNAVDVIEIDGASNRGIDDMRTLREGVISAPVRFSKKIYVIDEVHMLTKEAFNALLKTLEEPPAHVMFIFATTEPNKLPETIISRTFHISFQRATEDEIQRSLKKVIEGEKLKVDDGIVENIVRRADGGFRDSIKMLEQLAFANNHITNDVFASVFPQGDIPQFLKYLSNKNAVKCFEWIKKSHKDGVDWIETFRELLNFLQDELILISRGEKSRWDYDDLRSLINLCVRASKEQKFTIVETLPISLVVADWCTGSEIGEDTGNSKTEPVSSPKKEPAPTPEKIKKQEDEIQSVERIVIKKKPLPKKVDKVDEKVKRSSYSLTVSYDELSSKWDELLCKIREDNYSVTALLRNSKLESVNGDTVIVKVFYQFHKDQLESDKNIFALQSGFEQLFACRPKISYILGAKDEKEKITEKRDEELVAVAGDIFT